MLQIREEDSRQGVETANVQDITHSGCITHAPQPPHTCIGLCLLLLILLSTADALRWNNQSAQSRQPIRLRKRDCALTASLRLKLTRALDANSRPPRAPCLGAHNNTTAAPLLATQYSPQCRHVILVKFTGLFK